MNHSKYIDLSKGNIHVLLFCGKFHLQNVHAHRSAVSWVITMLHFFRELSTWDLHAHKAFARHGHRITISNTTSISPDMVETEGFISKGIA